MTDKTLIDFGELGEDTFVFFVDDKWDGKKYTMEEAREVYPMEEYVWAHKDVSEIIFPEEE